MRSRETRTRDEEFSDYLTTYFEGKTVKLVTVAESDDKRTLVSFLFEDDHEVELRLEDKPYEGTPPLYELAEDRRHIGMSWR